MKIIKIVIVLALFLVALALGSQNQAIVNFNYLIAQGEFHLSTLLGVVFVTGFAISWLIFGSLHLKSQLQVRKLKKQVKKLSPATEQATQVKAS
ncbi:lipopolysaccharide assembly protein LapA domain-containing protein [Vibrio sp. MarTm2]|jgi:putative membrane protein|uniref:Probable lipopolysaccharide assembly protein A n=3 Tax=Vibrio TaxID=662 RepID=A0A0A5HX51_PHOS4|nr:MULTISPECIES: lipopolysaccharide assembly protein LapA domain-containing protein [Vibrio]KGY08091.1 membrane protein [Vibrio sinaloensis]KHA61236.1 membrane protein [Vibrio variabilis]KHT45807.1 membrane protein [Vibrio sinaloensis]KHT50100.1 membrane protein [Vibrio sinaloensis]KIE19077.1 membrane protein [Vibrio sinaloensis]